MIMSTYAISDIHGNLAIARQIVRKAIEGNTIYFLGDACDRGNHGWEIIKMFLTTPNIVYLRGNHEDMLMQAMKLYFLGDEDYRSTRAFEVWEWNGSVMTEFGINQDNFERAHTYFSQLHTTQFTAEYTNKFGNIIYLCHSGWEYFLRDKYHDLKYKEKILWDRTHYTRPIAEDLFNKNEFIIHGHTPIPYLLEEIAQEEKVSLWKNKDCAWHYCDGHKIDIDMLTIKTHRACLIDLDTFEEIILEFSFSFSHSIA